MAAVISVNIFDLPNDGGSPITDIEYRLNLGSAISLGTNVSGSYTISANIGDSIQLRAINKFGPADWSDTKFILTDQDAINYVQAIETADGEPLEAGIRAAYEHFITGCKADGIWDAIKASCIMAGARTLSGALVPLAGPAPTNFNFVGDDYDRVTGLKGDGATKFIATGVIAISENNTGSFAFTPTEPATSSTTAFGGAINTTRLFGRTTSISVFGGFASFGSPSFPINGKMFGLAKLEDNSDQLYFAGNGTSGIDVRDFTEPRGQREAVFFANNDSNPPAPFDFADSRLSFYMVGDFLDLGLLGDRVNTLTAAINEALT